MTAKNSIPMARPNLARSFRSAGKELADLYRKHLPKAILGTPYEQQNAQRLLTAAADKTSEELKRASKLWIGSDELTISARVGGKRAAHDINVKFGGANEVLVRRMAYEAGRELIVASDSTRPFLAQTIRRSQAIAIKSGSSKAVIGVGNETLEQAFNKSILQGGVMTEHSRKITKRIMAETGLEKGDKVLLLNGQQWGAENYASLLSETRKAEVENLAYADQLQQSGYEFIETSQHAGVAAGDICEFLQGKVWALSENNMGIPVFPMEYGFPPWHPHCGHTIAVWTPEFNGGDKAISAWAKKHEDDSQKLKAWQAPGGGFRTMQPKRK